MFSRVEEMLGFDPRRTVLGKFIIFPFAGLFGYDEWDPPKLSAHYIPRYTNWRPVQVMMLPKTNKDFTVEPKVKRLLLIAGFSQIDGKSTFSIGKNVLNLSKIHYS